MDVQISFGSHTAARAAPGMSQTTYRIIRTYLQGRISLRILRGGLQQGTATVETEPVECNDATLIIGAQPQVSFFHGGVVGPPAGKPREDMADSTAG